MGLVGKRSVPDHSRLKILAIATRNAYRELKYRYQIKTALSKQRHELATSSIYFIDKPNIWEYNPKYGMLKKLKH
jgi:hypothetical protein